MRVLIVDDHELIRRGVRALLVSQPDCDVCGEAVDGQDAVQKAKELKPDVIVMDVSMPNLNGLEATRQIRGILPQTEVLILTQHQSTEMVRQALHAGARGYVVKSSISKHLLAALQKVRRHEPFFDSETGIANSNIDAQNVLQRTAALEQALRESEERFRSTFERAGVGVAHVGPDGHWLWLNRKFCEILGYDQNELINMRIQDVTHAEDLDAHVGQVANVRAGLVDQYSLEKRYIRKDGSVVWASLTVSAVRNIDRTVKYFISVAQDIDERKLSEQARYTLAAIVDSSDDAIVSKNLYGVITSWNAAAERIFGFTAEEAVGQPVTIIIPPELRHEEAETLKRLKTGERIEHFETVRRTKSGERLYVSLTTSPIRDSEGRVVGASKIARDISERKQTEVRLQKAHDELEQRVAARTAELQEKNKELVKQTDVVRELSGRLLRMQDEERRHIARELHDSVGQLLASISMNISSVAKEKGKLSLAAARCVEENASLIEQVSREIRTMSHLLHPPLLDEVGLESALSWYVEGFAERSKINVALELPSVEQRMPRELELCLFRIVQECLTNIHRHSESSTAMVRISRAPAEVKLEVEDRGKGIAQETQSRISSGETPGVGLRGMRERVRQLGGQLEVRSDDKGTVVIAVLPFSETQTPSADMREHLGAGGSDRSEPKTRTTRSPDTLPQSV
jgi:PAS domain S-box-containing protein